MTNPWAQLMLPGFESPTSAPRKARGALGRASKTSQRRALGDCPGDVLPGVVAADRGERTPKLRGPGAVVEKVLNDLVANLVRSRHEGRGLPPARDIVLVSFASG